MEIFNQFVYEYRKGIRDLILYTCNIEKLDKVEHLLKLQEIDYLIYFIGNEKINIFFGNSDCLEILKNFSLENLSELTDEEDFMLGIMLGYSRKEQYGRYLDKKSYVVC